MANFLGELCVLFGDGAFCRPFRAPTLLPTDPRAARCALAPSYPLPRLRRWLSDASSRCGVFPEAPNKTNRSSKPRNEGDKEKVAWYE